MKIILANLASCFFCFYMSGRNQPTVHKISRLQARVLAYLIIFTSTLQIWSPPPHTHTKLAQCYPDKWVTSFLDRSKYIIYQWEYTNSPFWTKMAVVQSAEHVRLRTNCSYYGLPLFIIKNQLITKPTQLLRKCTGRLLHQDLELYFILVSSELCH